MRAYIVFPAMLLSLACGGGDEPEYSDETGDHSGQVSATSSDNAAPDADIAGTYAVTGTNPDGSAYQGSLTVTARGDVYQFSWATGQNYEGVGVVSGRAVAVGWGGAECGAVLYRPGSDGTLSGRWALYENESAGTETARHSDGGSGLAGAYTVEGSNPDGTAYSGTLTISPAGESYRLQWESGGTYVGQGIAVDDLFGTSYGTENCGVAVYHISDGSLEGTWTTYGESGVGTERAVKG
jgi:hypothetical protein